MVFEELFLNGDDNISNDFEDQLQEQNLNPLEIFITQIDFASTGDGFRGACIDSSAQRTAIGRRQSEVYINQVGENHDICKVSHYDEKWFRFGATEHYCVGILNIYTHARCR